MSADLHTLTGAYALHSLPEHERARFEEHRDACEACRLEVAELEATAARLGELLAQAPPPSLRRQVLDEIDRIRQEPPVVRRSPGGGPRANTGPAPQGRSAVPGEGRSSWSRWAGLLTSAAAAVAVLAVGIALLLSGGPQSADEIEAAGDAMTDVLAADDTEQRTAEGPDGALGRVLVSTSRGQAVFVADRLEPAPPEHTYELWLIDGERAHSAGRFDVDDTRRVVRMVEGDLARAAAIGVTVEPAGGSTEPTSEPVLLIELDHA